MRYMTKRERIVDDEANRELRLMQRVDDLKGQLDMLGGPLTGHAKLGWSRELLREMKRRLLATLRATSVEIVTREDVALQAMLERDPDIAPPAEAKG